MYNIVYVYTKNPNIFHASKQLEAIWTLPQKQYTGYANYLVFIFTECLHCTSQAWIDYYVSVKNNTLPGWGCRGVGRVLA